MDATKRYYIMNENGEVSFGPAPLPYFWNDAAGDPVEISRLDEAGVRSLGFRPLEVEGHEEVDPGIKSGSSVIENRGTSLVEVWTYTFSPTARTRMQAIIDEAAEAARARIAVSAPLQSMVYLEKYREAVAFVDDPEPAEEKYPLLASSIGIDGDDLFQVASVILYENMAWRTYAANIESIRLRGKKSIREADTDDAAYAIFKETLTQLGA